MITRVQLLGWKGCDRLDLELGPGTTFLVAPNGVGKTSLLQAVSWALLGEELSGVDGDAAARPGEATRVRLALTLPDGREATVTRSVRTPPGRGRLRTDVEFTIGGARSTGAVGWLHLLSGAWSAAPLLLGRLVVGLESAVWEEQLRPVSGDVGAAVRAVLGIDALESLAAGARTRANRARTRASEARSVPPAELEAARADAAAAEREHASAVSAAGALRDAEREHWHRRADGRARAAVEEVLGPVPDGSEPSALLRARIDELTLGLATDRATRAVSAVSAVSAGGDEQLPTGGVCPVCLRPVDEATRDAAHARHDERQELDARIASAEALLARVRRVETLLHRDDPPPDAASAELVAARRAAEDARDRLGAARTAVQELADRDRRFATGVQWSRREALLRVVEATAQSAAAELTDRAVEPLARVVREQAARLPLPDDVRLDHGRLAVDRHGTVLPYDRLSGGEKATALLLYRVAALKTLTAAPLLVLDEPLEHLDPDNRWLVGQLLVGLCESGVLTQTLVTTYEEPLARQLARTAERSGSSAPVTVRHLGEREVVGTGAA